MKLVSMTKKVVEIWGLILSLGKVILLSKKTKLIPIKTKNSDGKCILIGNGPSLKTELLSNYEIFKRTNSICVNYFPISEEFIRVKPNGIVLHAPEFWIDNVKEEDILLRQKLFSAIIKKTYWGFTIYAPIKAKKSKAAIQNLLQNKHVHISFYNDTPLEGSQSIINFLLNQGFGLPRPHNVIVPALIIALRQNFKQIYLTGVDHSWLKEISVDPDNNVLVGQYHFYDDGNVKPATMNKVGRKKTRNLAEVLEKFLFTFRSYYQIKEFARTKNAIIYNSTKLSFIDAFDRMDLKNINN